MLYFICVIRIGAALTGAILSAVGMTFGTIIPIVIKGSGLFSNAPDLFSPQGMVLILALLVLIAGVVLVIKAGFERQKTLSPLTIPGGFNLFTHQI